MAFVKDPVEIKKLMESLGLPDFTAPPALLVSSSRDDEERGFIQEMPDYEGSFYDGSVYDGSVHDGSVHDGSVYDGSVHDA